MAKYKVIELLNANNIASHLFLDCVRDGVGETNVAESITSANGYSLETEVDIRLTFNGIEVKVDNFLKHLENEFFKLVDKQAQRKFEEQFPKPSMEDMELLCDKLQETVNNYKNNLLCGLQK